MKLWMTLLLAGLSAYPAFAGPVTIPNTFTAGTPARAGEVNANFNAVATAVNDNASRLETVETNAAKPDLAPDGNLLLGVSTPTSGNIIKDARPFLHAFGSWNTFLGSGAGNFTVTGTSNTAVGSEALEEISGGYRNSAFGASALAHSTGGSDNTAAGYRALQFNTTGSGNTVIGKEAMAANNTGSQNTVIGTGALSSGTNVGANAVVGHSALTRMVSGELNTAVGFHALEMLPDGDRNVAIGQGAGRFLQLGDLNLYLANPGAAEESFTIRIGETQTRTFISGIRGITTGSLNAIPVVIDSNGQLGTISSSRRFKEDIADMGDASSLLMQLRPVTFHYRSDNNPNGRTMQYGLIAEEVAEVAPGLVAHSNDGEVETVFYEFLTPMLLNEMQKQQRTINAQQDRLAQLERQVATLRKQAGR
jgi:endosialidase-like protein